VALIHADDRHHVACKEALKKIRESLGTVWPAVTEAMYLLGFSFKAQDALWRLFEGEAVKILPLESEDVPRMRELMRKYRDLPMDLAGAALVRVAEREKVSRIFTIDRRDFELCRPRGIRRFTILP
jgi:predicted nucleic acid-binding protein